jgi:hypothetical protein
MDEFGKALSIIIVEGTGREALPNGAGQGVEGAHGSIADRIRDLLDKGHGFPFGSVEPVAGRDACGKASPLRKDDSFRLTKARRLGEDQDANHLIFPGSGRMSDPPSPAGCFVKPLGLLRLLVFCDSQITLRRN